MLSPVAEASIECPDCGDIYPEDVFNCPGCEVILSLSLDDREIEPRESTVIMRMIAPPDASLDPPEVTHAGAEVTEAKQATSPTIRMPYPDPREGIPVVMTGADLLSSGLTVFEAFVVSHVDGRSTIEMLRPTLGLSRLEFAVVLNTLKVKGILRVEAPPDPQPKRKPPPVPEAALEQPVTSKARGLAVNLDPGQRNPLEEAIRLERAGKLALSLRVLEKAIAASADPAPLYNRMAIVLLKENRDCGRAESLVRKAIDLDGDNPAYTHNLYKILCLAASKDENPEVKKGIWGKRRRKR